MGDSHAKVISLFGTHSSETTPAYATIESFGEYTTRLPAQHLANVALRRIELRLMSFATHDMSDELRDSLDTVHAAIEERIRHYMPEDRLFLPEVDAIAAQQLHRDVLTSLMTKHPAIARLIQLSTAPQSDE